MTTIVVPNRVTSSSSASSTSLLSQQQQHHHNNQNNEVDDDVQIDENNDGNNNQYNQNNNNNNNNTNTNNNKKNTNNFFDDWKKGNWCWERDYDKHPVVLISNNNNNNNNNNCLHNNVDSTTIKVEEKNDEDKMNDDNNNEYSINDRARRDDIKNASDPDITGKGDNNDDDSDDVDDSFYDDWVEGNWCLLDNHKNNNNNNNNKKNDKTRRNAIKKAPDPGITGKGDNDDDDNDNADDDDSFYDDWVEGNWCLLDTKNNNNNKNSNDDDDTSRETTCTQNNNSNNESSKRKRKRSRDDDDKEDEDIYEEEEEEDYYDEENKDGNDDDDDDGEYLPGNNNDVRNHQEDERSAVKNSTRRTYISKHQNQVWMEMFEELVEYKKLHQHTQVPRHYEEVPKLGWWVVSQRHNCKKVKLLPQRIALLNSIDFEWEGVASAGYKKIWMTMFRKLVAYKKLCKDTMVPQRYKEDPKLGQWVSKQRRYNNYGRLLPQRLALLNSIDFEWDGVRATNQILWMIMFRKLVAYKKLYKDTMVPYHYMDDPKLGKWVSQQRCYYKKDTLLPQRLDLLNSIDFIWNRSKVAR